MGKHYSINYVDTRLYPLAYRSPYGARSVNNLSLFRYAVVENSLYLCHLDIVRAANSKISAKRLQAERKNPGAVIVVPKGRARNDALMTIREARAQGLPPPERHGLIMGKDAHLDWRGYMLDCQNPPELQSDPLELHITWLFALIARDQVRNYGNQDILQNRYVRAGLDQYP